MNKAEFIAKVAEAADAPKCVVEKIMNEAFAFLRSFPDTGESLTVMNFGRFYAHKKPVQKVRNPRTNEPMTIPARTVLAFKYSKGR